MAATPLTLRLPRGIFNPSLTNHIIKTWFADLSTTATTPSAENVGVWFGVGRSADERRAFDEHLHNIYFPALIALDPKNLSLPPFQNHDTDRANAPTLCLPLRRLPMLKTPAQDPQTPSTDINERARHGLALVLLLDQISRNCYRTLETQPRVFAHYDRIARAFIHCMLAPSPTPDPPADSGAEVEDGETFADLSGLSAAPVFQDTWFFRMWFYMPLMHSEDLRDHDLFSSLADDYEKGLRERHPGVEIPAFVQEGRKSERQHREILEKFGRYPHRNECLGREMTVQEKEYLDAGGETFNADQREEGQQ